MTNQEEDPLYREKLREERRIRNKIKRENKKANKIKNKSQNNNNNNIAIVSQEFIEEYKRKLDNTSEDRLSKKHPIVLVVDECKLIKPKKDVIIEDKKQNNEQKGDVLSGNRLDSTHPVRHLGKHREIEKAKKPSRLKREMISFQEKAEPCKEIGFKYCDNVITDNLEKLCETFINRVVELQEKLYKRDPIKGDIKRRYFVGFHEIKKYLIVKKLKILIIAKDLKITGLNDPLYNTLKEIIEMANHSKIPYVFALKRRKIGVLTLKYLPISCIGVRDYDGAHEQFKALVEEISLIEQPKAEPATPDKIIQPLVEKLREELVIDTSTPQVYEEE